MMEYNRNIERESVSHMTRSEPYAIHRRDCHSTSQKAVYLHWHPEAELFFLTRGEMRVFVEETCYRLREGEAIFVPPNLLHRAIAETPDFAFEALVFSTDLIASPSSAARYQTYIQPVLHQNVRYVLHLTRQEGWQQTVLDDFCRILHASAQGERDVALLVEGLLRVIWQSLYDRHFLKIVGESCLERTEKPIRRVMEFVRQNYAEEITLSALAKVAYVSEGQLCRSFKQMTGSTPFAWLKKYRILKSCEWLLSSDKKISEICTLCGFNNISYYNREFLKLMKVTPSEFRKERL